MMRAFASAAAKLRALFDRRTSDVELDEELRYHLERETERNLADGMSADEARFAARRAFGNPTVVAEDARDAMRWRPVEEFRQDVAFAVRSFRRAPTFVATVVVTIGLGLGLMTAAFTLFDAYVLRPVAVRDPSTLYAVAVRRRCSQRRQPDMQATFDRRRSRRTFDCSRSSCWPLSPQRSRSAWRRRSNRLGQASFTPRAEISTPIFGRRVCVRD
jgi:hypothetical protein